MAQQRVQSLDWHLKNFPSIFHPRHVIGSGESAKLIAPTRLRKPFPSSEVFTTVHGNATMYWRIRLEALPINSDSECWGFHIDLLKTEIKSECGGNDIVDIISATAATNGSDVNQQAKIQIQYQLFLLTHSGNETCYSIKPTMFCFDPYPRLNSTRIGWPYSSKGTSIDADTVVEDLISWMAYRDDTIHIRLNIIWVNCTTTPRPRAGVPNPGGLMSNFIDAFSRLLKSGDESDIVIKCGPDSFPVHKFILSLRSPVFKAMLEADMTEARSGVITIQDSEPLVMRQLLDFIYTAKIQLGSLDNDQIIELMAGGDKYGLADLKEYCFQHLLAKLNDEVCGKLAIVAHLHNAEPSQKDVVYNYVAERWKTLGTKKEFQALVKQYPAAFLKE